MRIDPKIVTQTYPHPGIRSTLNKMGFVFDYFTEYGQAFLESCACHAGPVLELGAAYEGLARQALEYGSTAYVNDLDTEHLKLLQKTIPHRHQKNFRMVPGRFPEDLDFEDSFFPAIYSSNMFHFLRWEEMERGIQKINRWLKKGGYVYLITGSPFVRMLETFMPTYEERKSAGHKYPGHIDDISILPHPWIENLPQTMNFMEKHTLEDAFKEVGFEIKKSGYINRHDFPPHMRWDGRENVGLIACKT